MNDVEGNFIVLKRSKVSGQYRPLDIEPFKTFETIEKAKDYASEKAKKYTSFDFIVAEKISVYSGDVAVTETPASQESNQLNLPI